MDRLQTEQTQLLSTLLEKNSTPAPMAADSATHAASPAAWSDAAPATNPATDIPAAFLVGNSNGPAGSQQFLSESVATAQLDASTSETIDLIRTKFVDAVQTAPAQDPASRAYRQNWNKARRDSDEFFSSMYGGDALIGLQQQALKQETAAAK
jgi:hypothetical protein